MKIIDLTKQGKIMKIIDTYNVTIEQDSDKAILTYKLRGQIEELEDLDKLKDLEKDKDLSLVEKSKKTAELITKDLIKVDGLFFSNGEIVTVEDIKNLKLPTPYFAKLAAAFSKAKNKIAGVEPEKNG